MPLRPTQIASLLLTKGVDVGRGAVRSLAVAVAGACLIALTSCSFGSEDEPATAASTASQPPSEPATQEGQPTRSSAADRFPEPVLPVQAQGTSVRSAEAFVEHYIDLLNYAMVTGDTKAFRAASQQCEGCEGYADLFDEVSRNGGSAKTRGWTVDEITAYARGATTFVVFNVRAAPVLSKPSASASATLIPAATYALRLVLSESSDGWKATKFTQS